MSLDDVFKVDRVARGAATHEEISRRNRPTCGYPCPESMFPGIFGAGVLMGAVSVTPRLHTGRYR